MYFKLNFLRIFHLVGHMKTSDLAAMQLPSVTCVIA